MGPGAPPPSDAESLKLTEPGGRVLTSFVYGDVCVSHFWVL